MAPCYHDVSIMTSLIKKLPVWSSAYHKTAKTFPQGCINIRAKTKTKATSLGINCTVIR